MLDFLTKESMEKLARRLPGFAGSRIGVQSPYRRLQQKPPAPAAAPAPAAPAPRPVNPDMAKFDEFYNAERQWKQLPWWKQLVTAPPTHPIPRGVS